MHSRWFDRRKNLSRTSRHLDVEKTFYKSVLITVSLISFKSHIQPPIPSPTRVDMVGRGNTYESYYMSHMGLVNIIFICQRKRHPTKFI